VTLPHHDVPGHVTLPDPSRVSDRHKALEQSHLANFGGEHAKAPPANPVALVALGYAVLGVVGLTLVGLTGSISKRLDDYRVPMYAAVGLAVVLAVGALLATAGRGKGGKTQAWLSLLMGLGLAGTLAVAKYMA
jgi:hypothetical protein